jgi:hypothetical protein
VKIVIRIIIASLLLLPTFGSLARSSPAIAASTQVQFLSNFGGIETNQGNAYVAYVQYPFGQWYVFNTGTYALAADKTIISGGNRYDFDRWGCDGAVTITDLYNSVSSITISGQGHVYAWYILQDFAIHVVPSSLEVQSPNTAQYSFTVTRTSTPQDKTRGNLVVDLFASGMPWSANGPNYRFDPQNPTFTSLSTQNTITGTLYINTLNAAAGQYPITVSGLIEMATTSHETQVSLDVSPSCSGYPDLIITDFYWTPSNPGVGQAISITYTEKNQGECDAPGHRNALYIDGVLISNDDIGPLAASASQTRTFPQTWIVSSSGPHIVFVKADSTNVVYEGELGSDEENNNSMDKTLGSKIDTQLTVTVNPASVPPGGGTLVTVSGKLTRTDTGAGLSDKTISLTVPGQSGSANTNGAGDYSYSYVMPNLVEGSRPVSAYYYGDSIFNSCSAQTNLGVGKTPTTITINLNPTSISSGTPTTVTASGKLSSSDTGVGLNGRSVKLDWPSGSTTVTSDSTGSYSYPLTVTATQNWVFQATFSGDSAYLQSSNSAVLSAVEHPTPTLSVSPTSLDFGTSDTQKSFSISNTGGGTLTWSLSSSQSWLTASLSSASDNANVDVSVNRNGLDSGTYGGVITVNSNGGSQRVSVSMQVQVLSLIVLGCSHSPDKPLKDDHFTVTLSVENTGADTLQSPQLQGVPRYPIVDAAGQIPTLTLSPPSPQIVGPHQKVNITYDCSAQYYVMNSPSLFKTAFDSCLNLVKEFVSSVAASTTVAQYAEEILPPDKLTMFKTECQLAKIVTNQYVGEAEGLVSAIQLVSTDSFTPGVSYNLNLAAADYQLQMGEPLSPITVYTPPDKFSELAQWGAVKMVNIGVSTALTSAGTIALASSAGGGPFSLLAAGVLYGLAAVIGPATDAIYQQELTDPSQDFMQIVTVNSVPPIILSTMSNGSAGKALYFEYEYKAYLDASAESSARGYAAQQANSLYWADLQYQKADEFASDASNYFNQTQSNIAQLLDQLSPSMNQVSFEQGLNNLQQDEVRQGIASILQALGVSDYISLSSIENTKYQSLNASDLTSVSNVGQNLQKNAKLKLEYMRNASTSQINFIIYVSIIAAFVVLGGAGGYYAIRRRRREKAKDSAGTSG